METNKGKFNYFCQNENSDVYSFLSISRSFNDYLKFMFENIDEFTDHIKEARDDKKISDEEFIKDYYFERYSNVDLSNMMAEIVLGKPAKLVLLKPYFSEIKVLAKNICELNRQFDLSYISNDLIAAVDSNLSEFDVYNEISIKKIKAYAINNQLKFLNTVNLRSYFPSKEELKTISNEHISSLKSTYSKEEYYNSLYEYTCGKMRGSLTDDVLKHDAREFKVICIEQMKTSFEEYSVDYLSKRDPEMVELLFNKKLEKK